MLYFLSTVTASTRREHAPGGVCCRRPGTGASVLVSSRLGTPRGRASARTSGATIVIGDGDRQPGTTRRPRARRCARSIAGIGLVWGSIRFVACHGIRPARPDRGGLREAPRMRRRTVPGGSGSRAEPGCLPAGGPVRCVCESGASRQPRSAARRRESHEWGLQARASSYPLSMLGWRCGHGRCMGDAMAPQARQQWPPSFLGRLGELVPASGIPAPAALSWITRLFAERRWDHQQVRRERHQPTDAMSGLTASLAGHGPAALPVARAGTPPAPVCPPAACAARRNRCCLGRPSGPLAKAGQALSTLCVCCWHAACPQAGASPRARPSAMSWAEMFAAARISPRGRRGRPS